MPEPYVQVFDLPPGVQGFTKISTVVLDREEFEGVVQELTDALGCPQHAPQFLKAEHIPLVAQGSKTAFVFDRFGIRTKAAAFIVRGAGPEILKAFIGNQSFGGQ